MAQKTIKDTKSEKYKFVVKTEVNDKTYWRVNMRGVSKIGYPTERAAALVVDKYLIGKGKEPVNILIRQ
jgi:hypothetical protein|tara:strand:+ start:497 stop:703 length:207 start_codon:yes stop_codon:yes gene_type:complete